MSVLPDPRERPTVSVEEACKALGVSRATGYRQAQTGMLCEGVKVIRVASRMRVRTLDVVRVLGFEDGPNGHSRTLVSRDGSAAHPAGAGRGHRSTHARTVVTRAGLMPAVEPTAHRSRQQDRQTSN